MQHVSDRRHGGLHPTELEALGLDAKDVLDFSVNVNPFGPSPAVRRAIASAAIESYPDPESWKARRALSARLSLPVETLALGPGACELLWSLARMLHRPGTPSVCVEPTFSEYAAAVRSTGGRIVSVRTTPRTSFSFPLDEVVKQAQQKNVASVYLCNPNSPLGQWTESEVLDHLARALAPRVLIVDQSFLSLSCFHRSEVTPPPENVVLVRSLTKELGTPGVRVGYLIAHPDRISLLEDHRPRWSVSAAAQAAVLAGCAEEPFLARSRERLNDLRGRLYAILERHRFSPYPSVTNYCTARLPFEAAPLRAQLLKNHGISIRDCDSFGLPDHARFAVRPVRDLERLDAALRQVVGPLQSCREQGTP